MPIDPQLQELLQEVASAGGRPLEQLTSDESRAAMAGLRAWQGAPAALERVVDEQVPTPSGPLAVRVYVPERRDGDRPLLLFFHGGGWFQGTLDVYDSPVRALAQATGATVVSVDYRLAPEHPYPAALEDAYAALCWAVGQAAELDADPARVGVAGDSSGGNIAAALAQLARDRGVPRLGLQLLIYPPCRHAFDTDSYAAFADGPLLTRAAMQECWRRYLAHPSDGERAYASPALGDLRGLPPAFVLTNEYDPLRDEGEAYAQAMRDAGVPVRAVRMAGLTHVSFHMLGRVAAAQQIFDEAGAAVREHLAARGAGVPAVS